MRSEVFVDDNFHYMDESNRYCSGVFYNLKDAINECRRIVNNSLLEVYKPGMKIDELLLHYACNGEDAYIIGSEKKVSFSSHEYASQRAEELCGKGDAE